MRPSRSLALAVLLLAACRDEPAADFEPPADGRLSEEQVRTYLGDAEGMHPTEREWVAARVREARTAGMERDLDQRIVESRRQILRALEEQRRTLSDPAKTARVDRQIAEIRRLLREAPPEVPPAVRHNAEVVGRVEKKP